jgi:hypothetical protein
MIFADIVPVHKLFIETVIEVPSKPNLATSQAQSPHALKIANNEANIRDEEKTLSRLL